MIVLYDRLIYFSYSILRQKKNSNYSIKVTIFQAPEFFLFGGLMIADMIIFAFLARRYKFATHNLDEEKEIEKANSFEILQETHL